MKQLVIFSILIILFSCDSNKQKENKIVNSHDKERKQIEIFSNSLKDSLNKYNYIFITKSWDQNSFENLFSHESKILRNLIQNHYKREIEKEIKNFQLNLVDKLIEYEGKIKLTKISHHENYSDISFALSFSIFVDFVKFRVKIINYDPKIIDIFTFQYGKWYSEYIKDMIGLNIKYGITSEERKIVNSAETSYKNAIENGNYRKALMKLKEFPKTHYNDMIVLKKLTAAMNINDHIYKEILDSEAKESKNLCISHFYATYYKDHKKLDLVLDEIEKSIGKSSEIESLRTFSSLWYVY